MYRYFGKKSPCQLIVILLILLNSHIVQTQNLTKQDIKTITFDDINVFQQERTWAQPYLYNQYVQLAAYDQGAYIIYTESKADRVLQAVPIDNNGKVVGGKIEISKGTVAFGSVALEWGLAILCQNIYDKTDFFLMGMTHRGELKFKSTIIDTNDPNKGFVENKLLGQAIGGRLVYTDGKLLAVFGHFSNGKLTESAVEWNASTGEQLQVRLFQENTQTWSHQASSTGDNLIIAATQNQSIQIRFYSQNDVKKVDYFTADSSVWGTSDVVQSNFGNPVQVNCNKYFVAYSKYPGNIYQDNEYGFKIFDKDGNSIKDVVMGMGHQLGTRIYDKAHGKIYNQKYGDNLLIAYYTGEVNCSSNNPAYSTNERPNKAFLALYDQNGNPIQAEIEIEKDWFIESMNFDLTRMSDGRVAWVSIVNQKITYFYLPAPIMGDQNAACMQPFMKVPLEDVQIQNIKGVNYNNLKIQPHSRLIEKEDNSLPGGAIAGIVIGVILFFTIAIIISVYLYKKKSQKKLVQVQQEQVMEVSQPKGKVSEKKVKNVVQTEQTLPESSETVQDKSLKKTQNEPKWYTPCINFFKCKNKQEKGSISDIEKQEEKNLKKNNNKENEESKQKSQNQKSNNDLDSQKQKWYQPCFLFFDKLMQKFKKSNKKDQVNKQQEVVGRDLESFQNQNSSARGFREQSSATNLEDKKGMTVNTKKGTIFNTFKQNKPNIKQNVKALPSNYTNPLNKKTGVSQIDSSKNNLLQKSKISKQSIKGEELKADPKRSTAQKFMKKNVPVGGKLPKLEKKI